MKHYLRAVRRRLRLPRDVRSRVMSDFTSAIEARREAGLTDDEIRAELGTPGEAAANLNEQMAEFAYEKSPWRWPCLAAVVLSLAVLLPGGVIQLFLLLERTSLGAIGGADGPTVIFVTSTPGAGLPTLLIALLVLALSAFGFWKLGHLRKK